MTLICADFSLCSKGCCPQERTILQGLLSLFHDLDILIGTEFFCFFRNIYDHAKIDCGFTDTIEDSKSMFFASLFTWVSNIPFHELSRIFDTNDWRFTRADRFFENINVQRFGKLVA